MRRLKWAALVSTTVALVMAAPAAAGTLDQQQPDPVGFGQVIGQACEMGSCVESSAAQTFTPAISGALDRVELVLLRHGTTAGPLTIEIRTVASDGCPSTTVLATAQLAAADVPEATGAAGTAFIPITFSDPANVTAGTSYAIVLYTTQSDDLYSVAGAVSNPYSGGQNCSSTSGPGSTWTAAPSLDLAFKTYVAEPPPPTPTADCQGTTVPTATGTEGEDNLVGTANADAIFGLGGNDELDGVDGNDCLDGGGGDDRTSGGADDDLVKGGDGRDKVRGVGGKDRLKGQGGVDRVNGGEGSDTLSGGRGADKLNGGAAKDRFKGNSGDDDLNAVDAKTDRVNCGGGDDEAVVDPIDRVSDNCEDVREVEKD